MHELYKLSLEKDGREVAELRASLVEKEFEVLPMDASVAVTSARFRHLYRMPMADSIIAASAALLRLTCISDDPTLPR